MDKDFNNLLYQFNKIANKNWIKAINNNHGAVGNTFEKELNKDPDSNFFPDYYGIEIKCSTNSSKYPLYLFTVAFDGPTFPEINRLVDLYGHPDKDFKDKNVLFVKLNALEKTTVDNKYKFKLSIDRDEEKIFLEVYDINDNFIEKKSYVYFKSIYNHLYLKLKNLAYVKAYKKRIDKELYFRYYSINLYKINEFDVFLYLLQMAYIKVDLIARISKSGNDAGRYRNKNLVFSIDKDKIEKLFTRVYKYNSDTMESFFIYK